MSRVSLFTEYKDAEDISNYSEEGSGETGHSIQPEVYRLKRNESKQRLTKRE